MLLVRSTWSPVASCVVQLGFLQSMQSLLLLLLCFSSYCVAALPRARTTLFACCFIPRAARLPSEHAVIVGYPAFFHFAIGASMHRRATVATAASLLYSNLLAALLMARISGSLLCCGPLALPTVCNRCDFARPGIYSHNRVSLAVCRARV